MKIRVANIIEEGKLGGPQVRIASVAFALKPWVETTVAMPIENSGRFRDKLEGFEVHYKTFNLSRITKEWKVALRYLFFSWYEIFRLLMYFRNKKFDLIHVSGGAWQYKGVIAGKLASRKVIWHLNDTSMPWLICKIFSVVNGLADGFIFASERSKKCYGSLIKGQKPQFVIPAPVDTTSFNITQHYSGREDQIVSWDGKIVIGTVSSINPIKGLDVFIRCAAELNQQMDNIIFVVVGPIFKNQRRYFNNLKKMCAHLEVKNIEFLGDCVDVRPLLQKFDIYLCTSWAESSPISVWEAMALGKPVVATDVGDVPLYVRDGFNGFITDVGNSSILCARMKTLISDKVMRREFGLRSREIAVRHLGMEQCAERHLLAYRTVLGLV